MIKIAIILFLVVLGADLWTDYRLWQDRLPINHVRGAWLRTAALVPTVAILAGFWPRWGEVGIPRKWLALLLTTVLMVGAVWWGVFDLFFNLLRGFPPMFNGSVDPDDSKLDTFLMSIPPTMGGGYENWVGGWLDLALDNDTKKMGVINEIKPEYVKHIPAKLDYGILYISEEFQTAIHLCACGCGGKTVTPLGDDNWTLTKTGEAVTLRPSIGNWSGENPYHAHYYITENKIQWL